MKKLLFISGLFLALLFCIPPDGICETEELSTEQEASIKGEDAGKDMQERFEQISKDLRNSNCLTPRRHIPSTYAIPAFRAIKNAVRIIQDIRIKEVGQLLKVSEQEVYRQTTYYSSLLCRTGYHIYALRKIII